MDDERHIAEKDRQKSDKRTAMQVDRDRLMYATCFARLAEVTQVISADHGYVFHNRLTHSLKVAQLSRRLAENLSETQRERVNRLGGIDPDAAESAGLAHDLGHPPFGHIAEEELNEAAKDAAIKESAAPEGFEGNAQSFRLVTRLAVGDAVTASNSSPIIYGLNLTRRTLGGILKYPWMTGGNAAKSNKWGAYKSEQEYFEFARKGFEFGPLIKSLEAEIMDWSDDITYAVHDVVDFYCAGKIPLERFAEQNEIEMNTFFQEVFNRKGNEKLKSREDDHKAAFKRVCEVYRNSIPSRYNGSSKEKSNLWHMMTFLITKYVAGISVVEKAIPNNPLVEFDKGLKDEIAMLKQLTWHYVILHNDLATVQHGQRNIVRNVFDTLNEASKKKTKSKLFPSMYEELIRSAASPSDRIRLVADYVSGMTEAEILVVYKKLNGIKVSPAL